MLSFKGLIRGPINPEDLAHVPDTDWILTSGMKGPTADQGRLYLIDTRDRSCEEVCPYDLSQDPDEDRYGPQPSAFDVDSFEPHGVHVVPGTSGDATAYVVEHGAGEAVQIFDIHDSSRGPRLRWRGKVAMPEGTWGNDVVGLAAGGFLVTSTADISDGIEAGVQRMGTGEETGKVVQWLPGEGWSDVPGTTMNSTNGLALLPREDYLFVAGWNSRCLRRVKFSGGEIGDFDTVDMPIMVDNLTLTDEGQILAAGAARTSMDTFAQQFFGAGSLCTFPAEVVKVDPATLKSETIIDYDEVYGVATTGLQVGDEVLVGSMRCSGVARFS